MAEFFLKIQFLGMAIKKRKHSVLIYLINIPYLYMAVIVPKITI